MGVEETKKSVSWPSEVGETLPGLPNTGKCKWSQWGHHLQMDCVTLDSEGLCDKCGSRGSCPVYQVPFKSSELFFFKTLGKEPPNITEIKLITVTQVAGSNIN